MSLAHRETRELELMDDPACDSHALERTYHQFRLVNQLVAGWRAVYRRRLRPLLRTGRTVRLLDVGSGGGDVPRALAAWAHRDGLDLDVTAIDPDPRAYDFAAGRLPVPGVRFRRAASAELVAEGERFDVVTSNHVLHHLAPAELDGLLADSAALATTLVVHDDIARSRRAYAAFAVATLPLAAAPAARRSFVRPDGLLSIRRSYRAAELAAVVPPSWTVERLFPCRLLLVHEPGRAEVPGPAGA